jgi:hypothetical protein
MTEYEKGSRAWEKLLVALDKVNTPQNQKWAMMWARIADKRCYDALHPKENL